MTVPGNEPKKSSGNKIACLVIAGVAGCLGIAVVGVIAAIAIPSFVTFQCRAKQSEAKTTLSSLYTAEKAFYADYGFYTSDLVALDWQPMGNPQYVYGFAYAGPDELRRDDRQPEDYDDARQDTLHEDVIAQGGFQTAKMVDAEGNALVPEDLPEDSWVEKDRFKAAAVADLSDDASGRLDVWTIDDQRNLQQIENDCSR